MPVTLGGPWCLSTCDGVTLEHPLTCHIRLLLIVCFGKTIVDVCITRSGYVSLFNFLLSYTLVMLDKTILDKSPLLCLLAAHDRRLFTSLCMLLGIPQTPKAYIFSFVERLQIVNTLANVEIILRRLFFSPTDVFH